jgi:exonuclease SbcC
MINIDYLIKRDEGDTFTEFSPEKIPSELPLLSYVQGPNSSGKSTLLNLLALAFFGLNLSNEDLNPDLKERIEALINSNHQNVKFKIEVENDLLGVKFVSEKKKLDSESIVVRQIKDGINIPINADAFKREYKLIYDIPNDPLGRLPLLLYTLRDQQKDIGADIANYRELLRKLIDDIKNAKDPELIEKIIQKINETELLLKENKESELNFELKLRKFKKYFFTKFYIYYLKEEEETNSQINKIKKQIKSDKKNQDNILKRYLIQNQELEKKINEVIDLIENIKTILPNIIDKSQKTNYEIWKMSEVRNEIYNPKIYYDLRNETKYFADYLDQKIMDDRIKYDNDLELEKFLKTLIVILSDYIDSPITIPGVNLSINDFITSLTNNLEELQGITSHLNNVEQCARSLIQLGLLMDECIALASEKKENEYVFSEEDIENISHQRELEELQKRVDGYFEKRKSFGNRLIKNDIDLDNIEDIFLKISSDKDMEFYEAFNENQLEDKLCDAEEKFKEKQTASKRLEKRIDDQKDELLRLESKEPHKYQDRFEILQTLMKHVQHLEKLFDRFDKILDNLISTPEKLKTLGEDEKEYLDQIGKYLAKKIGNIRHINNVYSVKSIDVLLKKLITNEGKVILFSDLGTGQGQAAYLETLLNMSEDKKIIALFDEVAMMDEISLQPIMEKLKKLYYEKKLLMAMIVQKSENVIIKDIL